MDTFTLFKRKKLIWFDLIVWTFWLFFFGFFSLLIFVGLFVCFFFAVVVCCFSLFWWSSCHGSATRWSVARRHLSWWWLAQLLSYTTVQPFDGISYQNNVWIVFQTGKLPAKQIKLCVISDRKENVGRMQTLELRWLGWICSVHSSHRTITCRSTTHSGWRNSRNCRVVGRIGRYFGKTCFENNFRFIYCLRLSYACLQINLENFLLYPSLAAIFSWFNSLRTKKCLWSDSSYNRFEIV